MRVRIWLGIAASATLLAILALVQVTVAVSSPAGTGIGEIPFTEHLVAYGMASSVHVADLDGDNDLDIVAANRYGGLVTWYENDGNQSFSSHPIESSGEARTVQAIDLDGDEDVDILAGDYDGITWWHNDGSETFTSTLVTTDTFPIRRLRALDLDDDGDVDILGAADSSTSAAPDVAWWENDGQQTFTRHVVSSSFGQAKSVYAADMDRDEDIDILAVSSQTNDVAWWENDGQEAFTEHTIDGYFEEAYDVYAADLNADTEMDVLAASWSGVSGDHSIAWWENDGAGTFTRQFIDNDTQGANCVRAVDLDDDGDLDVLGATVPELYWWENSGSQTFRVHLISQSIFAWEVQAVDMDGDGDLDVVAGSADSGIIAWYEQGERPFVVALPLVLHDVGPVTDIPTLYPIHNPDGDGDYTVSWSEVARASAYTLQEDDNPEFSSPRERYSGASTSRSISGQGLGTYYYRVNASNSFGSTGWSNIESVSVTVEPSCPGNAGTWSGSTDQGLPITFQVTSGCNAGSLTIEYLVTCPGGVMWKTHTFDDYTDVSDGSFHFDDDGDPTVDGSFSSTTRASGTWSSEFTSPIHCYGSGAWSAKLP